MAIVRFRARGRVWARAKYRIRPRAMSWARVSISDRINVMVG